jgi:hypothetical protein
VGYKAADHLAQILGVAAWTLNFPPRMLIEGKHGGEDLSTVLTFIIVERHLLLLFR